MSDTTFLLFKQIEIIVDTNFPSAAASLRGHDLRTGVCEIILVDNNVLQKWSQLTAGTAVSEHASLILLQLKVCELSVSVTCTSKTTVRIISMYHSLQLNIPLIQNI